MWHFFLEVFYRPEAVQCGNISSPFPVIAQAQLKRARRTLFSCRIPYLISLPGMVEGGVFHNFLKSLTTTLYHSTFNNLLQKEIHQGMKSNHASKAIS